LLLRSLSPCPSFYLFFLGGTILAELTRLLTNLKDLEKLKINNLLLELQDAPGVLEKLILNCSTSLTYLELRNFTLVTVK